MCQHRYHIRSRQAPAEKPKHLPAVIFVFRFFLPIAVQRKEDRADPDQHDNRKQPQARGSVAPYGGPQDFFICQCTDHGWPPPAARVHTARSEYTMVRRAVNERFAASQGQNKSPAHGGVPAILLSRLCAGALPDTGRTQKKLRTRRCAVCRYANRLSTVSRRTCASRRGMIAPSWPWSSAGWASACCRN